NNTTQSVSTATSSIDLNSAISPPQLTSTMTLGLNLSAAATAGSTFQSSLTTYTSLGESNTTTFTFVKQSAGVWNWGVSSSIAASTSSGTLTFDSTGSLVGSTQPVGGVAGTTDPSIVLTGFTSGAADQTINWDLFSALGTSNGDVTMYDGSSYVKTITQDGFGQGDLTNVLIDGDGFIQGTFSNGVVQNIAQLSIANFPSPWNLNRVGGTLWSETNASGAVINGLANAGGNGSIVGSTLEMSTVDMATEFSNMIQYQRAYQSSSKVITTADQMLQDAINLVR
ncbi:MAG: flagellar hook-basal body complex protein, partial [Nitrospinae bacterium]|nr:flagellar hook-basal body complex protein [Nitrospinota bacterium]